MRALAPSYKLSFRDLIETMSERGLQVAHTTILRWGGGTGSFGRLSLRQVVTRKKLDRNSVILIYR